MKMRIYILVVLAINLILITYLIFRPNAFQKSHIKIDLINEFYAKNNQKIDTLILGDSTIAFGLKPAFLSNSYSLAIPGATYLTVYKELNRFIQKKEKPQCLIVWTASIESYYEDYFWSSYIGSGLYDWKEIRQIYDESERLKAFPYTSYSLFSYLVKSFFYSKIYLSPIKQSMLFPFLENSKKYQELKDLIDEKKGFIPFFAALQKEPLVTDRNTYLFKPFYKIESDNIYLNEILSKTEKEKIKVIFLEMPILKGQDAAVYEFNEKHIQNINEILSKYKHAEILRNFVDLEEQYFRDISHLNAEGAHFFSKKMSSTIKSRCEKFD